MLFIIEFSEVHSLGPFEPGSISSISKNIVKIF